MAVREPFSLVRGLLSTNVPKFTTSCGVKPDPAIFVVRCSNITYVLRYSARVDV
jgi:hypothetical protein